MNRGTQIHLQFSAKYLFSLGLLAFSNLSISCLFEGFHCSLAKWPCKFFFTLQTVSRMWTNAVIRLIVEKVAVCLNIHSDLGYGKYDIRFSNHAFGHTPISPFWSLRLYFFLNPSFDLSFTSLLPLVGDVQFCPFFRQIWLRVYRWCAFCQKRYFHKYCSCTYSDMIIFHLGRKCPIGFPSSFI